MIPAQVINVDTFPQKTLDSQWKLFVCLLVFSSFSLSYFFSCNILISIRSSVFFWFDLFAFFKKKFWTARFGNGESSSFPPLADGVIWQRRTQRQQRSTFYPFPFRYDTLKRSKVTADELPTRRGCHPSRWFSASIGASVKMLPGFSRVQSSCFKILSPFRDAQKKDKLTGIQTDRKEKGWVKICFPQGLVDRPELSCIEIPRNLFRIVFYGLSPAANETQLLSDVITSTKEGKEEEEEEEEDRKKKKKKKKRERRRKKRFTVFSGRQQPREDLWRWVDPSFQSF